MGFLSYFDKLVFNSLLDFNWLAFLCSRYWRVKFKIRFIFLFKTILLIYIAFRHPKMLQREFNECYVRKNKKKVNSHKNMYCHLTMQKKTWDAVSVYLIFFYIMYFAIINMCTFCFSIIGSFHIYILN